MKAAVIVRFLALVSFLLGVAVPVPLTGFAQVDSGATMTVLSGAVAVIHTDGSAVQPAPSGTTVVPGDEIRTLDRAGALITFFSGTEIELGAETIMVVKQVSRQGDRVDVSLKQVFGISVSRVQSFTDPGSAYRVDSGGAVALVRGSELATYGPEDGLVVFVNTESTKPIIVEGCSLTPGMGVWFEVPVMNKDCNFFSAAVSSGPWNAVIEGFTTAQQARQGDTRGVPAGHVQAGRVAETRHELSKATKDDNPSAQAGVSVGDLPSTCSKVATSESTPRAPGSARIAVTVRSVGSGNFEYTQLVEVTGGTPNKPFEAFIFFSNPLAGHQITGTFRTDASGNATFRGSIVRPFLATLVDEEANTPAITDIGVGVRNGDHQYIVRALAPCAV